MKHSRFLAAITLAVGLAATATTLAAADRRVMNREYVAVNRRADTHDGQARFNDESRWGRTTVRARYRHTLPAPPREIRRDRDDWR